MIHDILVQLYHLLVGAIFVLGGYVIVHNYKQARANKARLLPLHVYMISISYLIVVATFLHPSTNYDPLVFTARFIALFMGIYALWVLVKMQRKQTK